jgi:hypothetical protein
MGKRGTSGERTGPAPDPGLWTLEQAGRYLGIRSHVTMRKLVRDEGLPVVKVSARVIRTRREWLDRWLESRDHSGQASKLDWKRVSAFVSIAVAMRTDDCASLVSWNLVQAGPEAVREAIRGLPAFDLGRIPGFMSAPSPEHGTNPQAISTATRRTRRARGGSI